MESTSQTTALVHQPREQWYRFSESSWSEGRLMLRLSRFDVIKKTPAGVWMADWASMHGKRFVLTAARKRYACPTIEEALASYHARKRRQACILRHQLARAEAAMTLQRDGDTIYFSTETELI